APGGRIELAVGADGAGRVVGGVRRIEPGRLLELDWRGPGEDPSVVRFELSPDGDGTLLVLDHRLIEEPVGMTYIDRWTRGLARAAPPLLAGPRAPGRARRLARALPGLLDEPTGRARDRAPPARPPIPSRPSRGGASMMQTITPYLLYADVGAALDFLARA